LNFEKFVAKRLHTEKNLQHSISKPILKMAIAAVSLSITVMILAIATGKGLQEKISAKVTGFTSDIQVTVLDLNQSLEVAPIVADSALIHRLHNIDGVERIQTQITKNGLIKTDTEFEGIIAKGVNENFDWSFIQNHIIDGTHPKYSDSKKSNQVVISKNLSQKLSLGVNQEALFYFQGKNHNQPFVRKFSIEGIYETGIELFDDYYVFVDQQHLRKMNRWSDNQCSAIELKIKKGHDSQNILTEVENNSPFDTRIISARDNYSQIFDWIKLFDMNIAIILLIMVIVACINMICSLLIIILERTKMIGLLKALGATQISIKKIFLYHAFYLLRKGLILGNTIGLFLIGIQYFFAPIQLDPEHYYVKSLPVLMSPENWAMINISSIIICMSMLIIPSILIEKVSPIKALRYE